MEIIMDPVTLPPITRVILQTADPHYSLVWDATAGVNIEPGTGGGTATHDGKVYALTAAQPIAAAPPPALSTDAPYNPEA